MNSIARDRKIIAVHAFPIWLPQTQTWMYNQIRRLPQDVEAHILCELTENLDQFWLPNIHALSEGPLWRYYWDSWLRRSGIRKHLGYFVTQAKKYRALLLHSHFGNVGWENMRVARKATLKHVVTFYGFDVSYLPRLDAEWIKRYRELFKSADRILCEGSHMAECIEVLGCPREKIRVHHLGVSLDEIAFKPRVWNPKEALRVLIGSSFQEKKGIPYALEALGRIQNDIQLEITLIGDANNEARSQLEKRKILETIARYNLGPKTRMLGYQPIQVFFEEAYQHHIFLSPSVTAADGDTEGGVPVSIIELAASGMPVVTTDHCDIREVVQHGVTGLLAGERDVEGLVGHLTWLIGHRSEWLPMVSAARKHLEAEYDVNRQGNCLAGIYRGVIEG